MAKQLLFEVRHGPASILGLDRSQMCITYTLKFMLLFGVICEHGPASILGLDRVVFQHSPSEEQLLTRYLLVQY